MPVLEIRALPQKSGVNREAALKRVCTELAKAMGEAPSGTWGTWTEIPPGAYAEGDDAPAVQPNSTHPPIVRLFAFEGRPPKAIERMLTIVADALSDALRVEKGNVFVVYDGGRSGRVYSGGRIIRSANSRKRAARRR